MEEMLFHITNNFIVCVDVTNKIIPHILFTSHHEESNERRLLFIDVESPFVQFQKASVTPEIRSPSELVSVR